MNKYKINKIEDIYPLTIISTRYGGKIVIFNIESDSNLIHDIQLGEESLYNLNQILEEKLSPSPYGIGDDLYSAFEDFKKRYYEF